MAKVSKPMPISGRDWMIIVEPDRGASRDLDALRTRLKKVAGVIDVIQSHDNGGWAVTIDKKTALEWDDQMTEMLRAAAS